MGAPELKVLSRDGCLALLATVPVGRVGLSIDALPVVLPVNFALLDGDVVFRTVNGTKCHAAAAGAVLAFEADSYEPDGTKGWGVVVPGDVESRKRPVRTGTSPGTDDRPVGCRQRRRRRRPYLELGRDRTSVSPRPVAGEVD